MSRSSFDEFLKSYFNNLPGKKYEQAYEQSETDFKVRFGKRKYKNYEVFRKSLHRFLKMSKRNCAEILNK